MMISVQAKADCTVLYDTKLGKTISEQGDCTTRHTAASTFKIPLALMGYDSGILKDEHHPLLPYQPSYQAAMPSWRHDTDPTYWEAESVVWYSQEMTRKLGEKKFRHYVDLFNYGDKNLSRPDALTHAWLTTLQISPDEQVGFLRHVLARDFPLSAHAYEMLTAILPTFPLDHGWTVHGKTGSASDKGIAFGWFVGWAQKGDHTIVFARYKEDAQPNDQPAGPRVRDSLLHDLPAFLSESEN